MKKNLLILTLILCSNAYAQTTISGRTISVDNQILSYTNIGIKQKNIGAVSNQKGDFSIDIPNEFLNDTLTFSYVGFKELSIPIHEIISKPQQIFTLLQDTISLQNVIISNKKMVLKDIGVKSNTSFIFSPPVNEKTKDIVEFAQFISTSIPSKIISTNIMTLGNQEDSVLLRINFYSAKSGLPNERIFFTSIIKTISVKKGWQQIPLEEYDIKFDQPFFISYEYIPTPPDPLFTYGARLGGTIYTRNNSLGKWKKQKADQYQPL